MHIPYFVGNHDRFRAAQFRGQARAELKQRELRALKHRAQRVVALERDRAQRTLQAVVLDVGKQGGENARLGVDLASGGER